jgi:hypothetical protein
MNGVDAVLHDELERLMDRLAATVPSGSLESTSMANPTLRTRLDDIEVSLALARSALLEDYGRWRQALDDLENVWALAAWAHGKAEAWTSTAPSPSAAPEQPAEYAAPRAA